MPKKVDTPIARVQLNYLQQLQEKTRIIYDHISAEREKTRRTAKSGKLTRKRSD